MAVVEEKGLFGVKEVKHVFKGLVVSDAVAAELKMAKGDGLGVVVDDRVFEDELETEFPFQFYFVEFEVVFDVFFCIR